MIALTDWKVSRKQKKLIKEVLVSGRLTYGEKTREFERQFAEIHGAKYGIFTSSGTAALKISIAALKDKHGWKDGSEIIIPSVTFVATMNAVLMNNLKPVLVDVRAETANIDSSLAERSISSKTVALLPVHLLGQPAEMDEIIAIARKHKLEVIEDSCETFGVHKIQSSAMCFSTYMTHHIPTGVGGMILTNDKKLYTVMRSLQFHGRDESYLSIDDKPKDIWKKFYFPRHGYSDRMTELEAAIGLGELDNWETMISERQKNAYYMITAFHNIYEQVDNFEFISINSPVDTTFNHSFMFLPIYTRKRDELMVHLEKQGIETRTMMPLITQPITKPYLKKSYPAAEFIGEHGLLLPCHQYLKKEDLDKMIGVIRNFYA